MLLITTMLLLSTGVAPGANPAMIDPMDPAAGDFLDLDTDMYRRLGLEAYAGSDYSMAARYFLAYLSRNSTDGTAIYNLACCYGLMDEAEMAAVYLLRAISAGFTDMELIGVDPDFDSVRGHPAFEAVTDFAEGLGIQPDFDGDRLILGGVSAVPCLYRLPEGYDGESEVPLVIGLHGYGDSPENFMRLWGLFDSPDFIFACPRGQYPVQVNGTIGWSWLVPPGDPEETIRLDLMTVDWIITAMDGLKDRFAVSEVYLIGFSQGCGLTWFTGLTRPEEFAGLIGLGGRLEPAWFPDSLLGDIAGMRAFAANGTEDAVGPDEAASAAVFMEDRGVEVTVSSWEGGHRVYRGILLEAQEWMKETEVGTIPGGD